MSTGLRRLVRPALATLAALVVLVSLGTWQLRRLAEKQALIASVAERPRLPVLDLPPAAAWPGLDLPALEYRPFRLEGRFLHEREALVFTSLPDPNGRFGGPGYWIVTPFALADGGTVLVNRGFAPHGRHLADQRGEAPAAAPVAVVGLLRRDDPPSWLAPEDRPERNLFYRRSVAAIAAAKQLAGPVAPFTVDLVAGETPPGGLPQAGETRMRFVNNHLGYAVTWFGLAAALAAVFAAFARQRLRQGPSGGA